MASASCVTPSLTYLALTARAVDHAVGLLNRRELQGRRDAIVRPP